MSYTCITHYKLISGEDWLTWGHWLQTGTCWQTHSTPPSSPSASHPTDKPTQKAACTMSWFKYNMVKKLLYRLGNELVWDSATNWKVVKICMQTQTRACRCFSLCIELHGHASAGATPKDNNTSIFAPCLTFALRMTARASSRNVGKFYRTVKLSAENLRLFHANISRPKFRKQWALHFWGSGWCNHGIFEVCTSSEYLYTIW